MILKLEFSSPNLDRILIKLNGFSRILLNSSPITAQQEPTFP